MNECYFCGELTDMWCDDFEDYVCGDCLAAVVREPEVDPCELN